MPPNISLVLAHAAWVTLVARLAPRLPTRRGQHSSRVVRPPKQGLAAYVRRVYTHAVTQLRFEWDRRKASDNVRKHRVSFDEAATAFSDDRALVIDDPDHHADEDDRLVLVGLSSKLRTLVVVHCYRESESVIRIISARRANQREESEYVNRYSP